MLGSRPVPLFVVLLLATLVACGDTPPADAPDARSIVGYWKTQNHKTQVGSAVFECRFGKDGSFHMVWSSLQTTLPPLAGKGTYVVAGDRIDVETESAGSPEKRKSSYTYTWDGDILLLSEGNDTWRLHKVVER